MLAPAGGRTPSESTDAGLVLNTRQAHQRSTEVGRSTQTISAETVGLIVRDQLADTRRGPASWWRWARSRSGCRFGAEWRRRRAGGAALAAGPVCPGALAAVSARLQGLRCCPFPRLMSHTRGPAPPALKLLRRVGPQRAADSGLRAHVEVTGAGNAPASPVTVDDEPEMPFIATRLHDEPCGAVVKGTAFFEGAPSGQKVSAGGTDHCGEQS